LKISFSAVRGGSVGGGLSVNEIILNIPSPTVSLRWCKVLL
jgi:hypothetical protein